MVGFADFAVGATDWSGGTANSGAVFVYGGGAGGPGAPLILPGAQVGARFGAAVAGVGDVNGDGFRDLLVGEPSASAGAIEEGRYAAFKRDALQRMAERDEVGRKKS